MVKTQRSTSQQSVTQDSDYLMPTLSRRTATTTRLSPKRDGAKVLPTSD